MDRLTPEQRRKNMQHVKNKEMTLTTNILGG